MSGARRDPAGQLVERRGTHFAQLAASLGTQDLHPLGGRRRVLEDLQSRNGTFVNGEKVTDKRLLADGDLIRIGKVIMTFNIAREAKSGEVTLPEVRLG